ncbi:MAG: MarR family transcriptional regulator [Hyphomicrobiales bacterium]|nr:MarR family transcriptional regulator [Hyphomicrobiales bacterium]
MPYDLNGELELGFLLHDVSRLRSSVLDRALKPLGVTRSQWWVLAFLSRADGLSQVALAEELDLGKVALGALVDRLGRAGLVSRKYDPMDRRIKRVHLTKAGGSLVAEVRGSVTRMENRIVDSVADADLAAAARALRGMKANLLAMQSETGVEREEADAA